MVLWALRAAARLNVWQNSGDFKQAIFRSPLMDSDRRTAKEEVARAERTGQMCS